jgi:hypothetical protein
MSVEEQWLAMNRRDMRKSTLAAIGWFAVSALGAIGMAAVFLCGH